MLQPAFRKVIADGDLILQKKGSWWLFGGEKWQPYRNESEEVRLLKEHMDSAFMQYKQMQHLFVVAQKNVQCDIELLQMHKMDNSEVEYIVPCELSILEERDGIKYSSGNSSGKQKQNNGNGNNQQNNQKGNGSDGGNNQNQKQNQSNKQRNQPKSLLELLTNVKVVAH